MEIELTLQDVEHLESKMEELVGGMTANMSSFSAIAFAVTVLSNAIEDAKKQLTDGETEDYAEDVSDEDCLQPRDKEYLISVKRGLYNVDEAVAKADEAMKHITESADAFCESHPDEYNKKTDELLDFVQYQIMKKCVSEELKNA